MLTTTPLRYESRTTFDPSFSGTAVVYCSDGRFGEPMEDFLHQSLGLARFDRLVVPGGAGCLAGHFVAWREEEALAQQLRFLVEVHNLRRVVLVAHEDCGFYGQRLGLLRYEVEEQQRRDLVQAAQRIRRSAPWLGIEAYFARAQDGRVGFERIEEGI